MSTRFRVTVLTLTLTISIGCAPADVGTVESYVTRDGRVVAEPATVRAGEVIVRIENDQAVRQRMVLVRTDGTTLPVIDHVVPIGKESDTTFHGDGYELVAKLDPMRAYFSGPPIVGRIHDYLRPGTYVLFSNLPGHYEAGKFVALHVEDAG